MAAAYYLSSIKHYIIEPENNETSARLVDGAEAAFAEQVLVGEVARGGGQLGEVIQREPGAALLDSP